MVVKITPFFQEDLRLSLNVSFLFNIGVQFADKNEIPDKRKRLIYTTLHWQYTNSLKGFSVFNKID